MPAPASQFFPTYQPSLAAAMMATSLFTVATATHVAQLVTTRTMYFIPFAIGGVLEIAAYVTRSVVATQYPDCQKGPFIVQTILPLMAPAQFATAMYTLLGRIIHGTTGEEICLIGETWRKRVLMVCDILSGAIQTTGGIMLSTATTQEVRTRGNYFIAAGLTFQILGTIIFLVVAIHYGITLVKTPTDASRYVSWQPHISVIYLATTLILVRTVFRMVEYIQGDDGALRSEEVYSFLYDTTLMLLVMFAFNLKHPSTLGPRGKRLGPDSDEASESNIFLLQERGAK